MSWVLTVGIAPIPGYFWKSLDGDHTKDIRIRRDTIARVKIDDLAKYDHTWTYHTLIWR